MNAPLPKPSECRTGPGSFTATFGKYELEAVAWTITVLSQQRGDKWLTNFTVKDVHSLENSSRSKFRSLWEWLSGSARDQDSYTMHWLNMLTEDGWLDASTLKKKIWFGLRTRTIPCFSINDHFANKVVKAQARNKRLHDPNNPNWERDVMAALGLIPD